MTKSYIDWNELFPLLPKTVRDSMLLEAVQIISTGKSRRRSAPRRPQEEANGAEAVLPASLRTWASAGDGHALAAEGRVYRIIYSRPPIHKGDVKELWDKLSSMTAQTVTFEHILRLNSKAERHVTVSHVNYLWRTGRLEVDKREAP